MIKSVLCVTSFHKETASVSESMGNGNIVAIVMFVLGV